MDCTTCSSSCPMRQFVGTEWDRNTPSPASSCSLLVNTSKQCMETYRNHNISSQKADLRWCKCMHVDLDTKPAYAQDAVT